MISDYQDILWFSSVDWEKNPFVVINLLTSLAVFWYSLHWLERVKNQVEFCYSEKWKKCYANRKLEGRFISTVNRKATATANYTINSRSLPIFHLKLSAVCLLLLLFSLAFFQSLLAHTCPKHISLLGFDFKFFEELI